MSSKRKLQLLQHAQVNRVKVIAAALSLILEDDDDDMLIASGLKRRRTHGLWMSPYLRDRTDYQQRNTLLKLEADFIRVSNLMTSVTCTDGIIK